MRIQIDTDIRKASTLPASCYHDPGFFRVVRERVLARSWQLLGDTRLDAARPATFLEGSVDEPLALVGGRCLSNVCTHRGHLVVTEPGDPRELRCRYHGRRFALDGRCLAMPAFEGVPGFPAPSDDLRAFPCEILGPLAFTTLDPAVPFAAWAGDLRRRMAWLPWDRLAHDASRARDYVFDANWALYCDNYLEGLHIPFVHPTLHAELDFGAYRTELFDHSVLQVGVGRDGAESFGPEAAAAYYWFLFPNLMLNFYPWGLSANVVLPLGPERTRVRYLGWVLDPTRAGRGAGADLEGVEREDQEVVLAVQRGVKSRVYDRGRYSPARERGVHHFHRLLAAAVR